MVGTNTSGSAPGSATISELEAWHLACILAGGPVDPLAFTSPLAIDAAAAMSCAMNGSRRQALDGFLITLDAAVQQALSTAIVSQDPQGPAPGQTSGHRFHVHFADEALLPLPPIVYTVEGLMRQGSVNLWVGPPGSKKTWALLDMGLCVALGAPWLGLQTRQGSVLFVDEESGLRRLMERLAEVMRGHSAGPGLPFTFTSLEAVNLRTSADLDGLDALLTEVQPSLVIVDALADIMPGADENAVKDTQPILQALRRLAEKHMATICIIHHAGKGGGYRGSTAIAGAVDLLLMVESEKDSPAISFRSEKARDTGPVAFAAEINFDLANGATWLTPVSAHQGPQYSKAEREVLDFLLANGPASVTDIKAAASVCSARSAQNAVYSLASKGVIRRANYGGKGASAIYEMTPIGASAPVP